MIFVIGLLAVAVYLLLKRRRVNIVSMDAMPMVNSEAQIGKCWGVSAQNAYIHCNIFYMMMYMYMYEYMYFDSTCTCMLVICLGIAVDSLLFFRK